MTMAATARPEERWWVPGDWNAFFGFGTNILVNVLVLTGLLRFVLKMPDDLVFGRILPALGLMLFLSTVYYAWLGYRLAKTTGRNDVCALPSGISVPHMFVVTFVVMLPILAKTNDPVQAWEAGLTWVFVQSFVLMVGGFIAPVIRRITPRAALLGSLAGISITFISMRPGLQIFETPVIGMVCLAIILANWFGGVRYYGGVPGGLVAIAVGTLIAWGSNLFGLGYGGLTRRRRSATRCRISAFRSRFRRSGMSFTASSTSASSWSPPSRSASTISSRRWTTSRAPRPPATRSRRRACSAPTASSA